MPRPAQELGGWLEQRLHQGGMRESAGIEVE